VERAGAAASVLLVLLGGGATAMTRPPPATIGMLAEHEAATRLLAWVQVMRLSLGLIDEATAAAELPRPEVRSRTETHHGHAVRTARAWARHFLDEVGRRAAAAAPPGLPADIFRRHAERVLADCGRDVEQALGEGREPDLALADAFDLLGALGLPWDGHRALVAVARLTNRATALPDASVPAPPAR
jgi:hypothetical protein